MLRGWRDGCAGLRRKERRGRTIAIKVRLDDFTTVTRARTLASAADDAGRGRDVAARAAARVRAAAARSACSACAWPASRREGEAATPDAKQLGLAI